MADKEKEISEKDQLGKEKGKENIKQSEPSPEPKSLKIQMEFFNRTPKEKKQKADE